MSKFIKVPNKLLDDTNLSFTDVGIYTLLQANHHFGKKSFISENDLCELAKIGRMTVYRSLTDLNQHKYIQTTSRRNNNGIKKTNETYFEPINGGFVPFKCDLLKYNLTASQIGFLLRLRRYNFQNKGYIYLTRKELCEKLAISPTTFRKYLKKFEDMGLIETSYSIIHLN